MICTHTYTCTCIVRYVWENKNTCIIRIELRICTLRSCKGTRRLQNPTEPHANLKSSNPRQPQCPKQILRALCKEPTSNLWEGTPSGMEVPEPTRNSTTKAHSIEGPRQSPVCAWRTGELCPCPPCAMPSEPNTARDGFPSALLKPIPAGTLSKGTPNKGTAQRKPANKVPRIKLRQRGLPWDPGSGKPAPGGRGVKTSCPGPHSVC